MINKQACATLLLSVFIALLGIGIVVPIMPIFASELGAGGMALGFIIASFSLSRAVLQPIVGNLSDKYNRKNFLLAGLLIYSVVGLFLPYATSIANLLFIRVIHGVGSAMIVPIAMAYMSSMAGEGEEGKYMSWLNIAIFSGIGCGPVIGGVCSDLFSIESAFHCMAGLSLFAFVLVMIYMPATIQTSPSGVGYIPMKKVILKAVKRKKTMGLLLARLATMIFVVPTMAFLPLFMVQEQLGTGLEIGIVMGGRTLMNAALQLPVGKIVDRYNRPRLFLISGVFSSLFVIAIPLTSGFVSIFLLYILLGLAEAVIWALLSAMAVGEGRNLFGLGSMMGLFNFSMSMGILSGAIISGLAMDIFGLDYSFYFSGISVLLLVVVAYRMITD